jgi:hypothetical protein
LVSANFSLINLKDLFTHDVYKYLGKATSVTVVGNGAVPFSALGEEIGRLVQVGKNCLTVLVSLNSTNFLKFKRVGTKKKA